MKIQEFEYQKTEPIVIPENMKKDYKRRSRK